MIDFLISVFQVLGLVFVIILLFGLSILASIFIFIGFLNVAETIKRQ